MNRLASIVVATAAAAAVAAAITMPAGAEINPAADAKFVDCLRAHNLDIPADTRGDAIKAWIMARPGDADVRRGVLACKQEGPKGPAPEALVACLKAHGLDAPSAIADLKPWLLRQFDNQDAEAALRACDVKAPDKGGVTDEKFVSCLRDGGADVPAGAEGEVLKTWLRDHDDEAQVKDALKRCAGPDEVRPAGPCGKEVHPATKGPEAEETVKREIQTPAA